MPSRRLGLVANTTKPGARELTLTLTQELARHGLTVHFDSDTAELIGGKSALTVAGLAERSELLIVLGGDGTMLQVLHAFGDTLCPLFGINLGALGFLTTVGATDCPRAVAAIVARDYELSDRTLLQVETLREGRIIATQIALNEAVISRGELSRLIRLNVRIGTAALTEYNADGLIIATPTGSTAYSLSAGGPILAPDSGVFVVNPICPHVLTNRAVIVSDSSPITIEPVHNGTSIYLTLDGQTAHHLPPGDTLRITKAPKPLPLAMLPGVTFYEVLRQKLKWSGAAV